MSIHVAAICSLLAWRRRQGFTGGAGASAGRRGRHGLRLFYGPTAEAKALEDLRRQRVPGGAS